MSRQAHRYRRTAGLFSSILMSAGLILAGVGGYACWRGWQTLDWPRTEGEIVIGDLQLEEKTRTVPMTDKHRGGREITDILATLAITYRYGVDGVAFEGRGLEPWDFGIQGAGKARAFSAEHPPGSRVEVAYDPRDPRRSYLMPGPSTTALTMASIGLALLAVGFLLGRIARRA
jgi:hypothetical protein